MANSPAPRTAPRAAAAAPSNLDAAAAVFGSLSLANGSGAEPVPMGLYTFAEDTDNYPALIGGAWISGVDGALTIEKELYDAPGQTYDGKPKSVKMLIVSNATGMTYRLSAVALQNAFKLEGLQASFAEVELEQNIDDSSGYSKATITLG